MDYGLFDFPKEREFFGGLLNQYLNALSNRVGLLKEEGADILSGRNTILPTKLPLPPEQMRMVDEGLLSVPEITQAQGMPVVEAALDAVTPIKAGFLGVTAWHGSPHKFDAGGLPMDEASRMQRAREMGHERGFWRGGKEPADGPWYARTKEDAENYARRKGDSPDVREYSLKMDNAFSYNRTYKSDDLGGIQKALYDRGYGKVADEILDVPGDWGGEAPGYAIMQIVDFATNGNAAPIFRDAGFDVIDAGKELIATHNKGVVRDAVKAAYDPAKKHIPDIMAGILAPTIGLSLLYGPDGE